MVKIKAWGAPSEQMARIDAEQWSVCRLFELARDLPVMEIPLEHMSMNSNYDRMTLRELVMHMKAVQDADLAKPIILDQDGIIMDGRHRLMKALLQGKRTIRAVRFEENPPPCRVDS